MAAKRFYLAAALLLGLTGIARPQEPTEGEALPKSIYTRQGTFAIPFRLEIPAPNILPPSKVRLFVSENEGHTWHLEAEVAPEKQGFDFRSPHDGEYWFTIRSIDAKGRSYPEGAYDPQLRVVVDTLAPRLDLRAERGAGGEIIAHWDVVDSAIDPTAFKLEYQSAAGAWQAVAVEPDSHHLAKLTLVGETLWWPPTGGGKIVLRASVADLAGNPAVSQFPLDENTPRAAQPAAGAQDASAAAGQPGRKLLEWPAEPTGETLGRAVPGAGPEGGRRGNSDTAWRASKGGPAERDPKSPPGERDSTHTVSRKKPLAGADAGDEPGSWPSGERPQMVNRRTFELDYEVATVGNSGVAKVELWGTRDGGRHWHRFGHDNDNRSPIVATVDAEGLFGFRVVIESGNGLASEIPHDGDVPEIWINVDLTKPSARIIAADVAHEPGELTIRWEAGDSALEPRPISLWFSDLPGGQWMPIASNLENSGSFVWRLDTQVPEQIYLRLEARDEAGNVGADEMRTPVLIDRQRPQGRIRGVRPAASNAAPAAGSAQTPTGAAQR